MASHMHHVGTSVLLGNYAAAKKEVSRLSSSLPEKERLVIMDIVTLEEELSKHPPNVSGSNPQKGGATTMLIAGHRFFLEKEKRIANLGPDEPDTLPALAAGTYFDNRRALHKAWYHNFAKLAAPDLYLQEEVQWEELLSELESMRYKKHQLDVGSNGEAAAGSPDMVAVRRSPIAKLIDTIAICHNTIVDALHDVALAFVSLQRRDIMMFCVAVKSGLSAIDAYCDVVGEMAGNGSARPVGDDVDAPSRYGWHRQEKRICNLSVNALCKLLWALWGRGNVLFYNTLWPSVAEAGLSAVDDTVGPDCYPAAPQLSPAPQVASPAPQKKSGGMSNFFAKLMQKKPQPSDTGSEDGDATGANRVTTVSIIPRCISLTSWSRNVCGKLCHNGCLALANVVQRLLLLADPGQPRRESTASSPQLVPVEPIPLAPTLLIMYDSAPREGDAPHAEPEAGDVGTNAAELHASPSPFHSETSNLSPPLASTEGKKVYWEDNKFWLTEREPHQPKSRRGGGVSDWVVSAAIPSELGDAEVQEAAVLLAMHSSRMYEDSSCSQIAEYTTRCVYFFQRGGPELDDDRTFFAVVIPVPVHQSQPVISRGQQEADAKKLLQRLEKDVFSMISALRQAWLMRDLSFALSMLH